MNSTPATSLVETDWLDHHLSDPQLRILDCTVFLPNYFEESAADLAREAFVHAMSRASIVDALVAALGAFIAWRHLPAREVDPHAAVEPSAAQPQAAVG